MTRPARTSTLAIIAFAALLALVLLVPSSARPAPASAQCIPGFLGAGGCGFTNCPVGGVGCGNFNNFNNCGFVTTGCFNNCGFNTVGCSNYCGIYTVGCANNCGVYTTNCNNCFTYTACAN